MSNDIEIKLGASKAVVKEGAQDRLAELLADSAEFGKFKDDPKGFLGTCGVEIDDDAAEKLKLVVADCANPSELEAASAHLVDGLTAAACVAGSCATTSSKVAIAF